ncbi:MAG: nucleotidyltransferase domain-containing protein [Thermodesulfovibrionales bacterium]|nr:nucleotidyltransferase domain-containing protein [Thermodesulfovibrionales bacterium]
MASSKIIRNLIFELPLNYNEQTGLDGIVSELSDKYPVIKRAILYGSKARGDSLEYSDLDILFITEKDISRQIKSEIYDIIYNHELANDIIVSAVFIPESDFRSKINTFIMKVKKEGVVIWLRE